MLYKNTKPYHNFETKKEREREKREKKRNVEIYLPIPTFILCCSKFLQKNIQRIILRSRLVGMNRTRNGIVFIYSYVHKHGVEWEKNTKIY